MLKQIKIASFAVVAIVAAAVGLAGMQAKPAAAANAGCTNYTWDLKWGSTGTCVRYLQRILNGLNASIGYSNVWLDVDGRFGYWTDSQVRAFQRQTGYLSADGRVGQKTWSSLCWNIATEAYEHPWGLLDDAKAAGQAAGCHKFVPFYFAP